MSLSYCVIEIFTSEEAEYTHKPLHEAVVNYVRNRNMAARCMVIRGSEGCYENGELVTQRLLELSYNMPIKIEILLPNQERDQTLAALQGMVKEGIVAVRETTIHSYALQGSFIPRQTRVSNVMTGDPVSIAPAKSVKSVMQILLSNNFNGLPVVDARYHPIGIITQGDLLRKAHMPLRLGLLTQWHWQNVDPALSAFDHQRVRDIMSQPAVVIGSDEPLTHAVDIMLEKHLKRLPVVNKRGELIGMLARSDIFHTITTASPHWQIPSQNKIKLENLRRVADIMRRDTHTVSPDTSVEDVLRIIDSNDIQRIAVTDDAGKLIGLIADRDLLAAFSEHHPGVWKRFISAIVFTEKGERHRALGRKLRQKRAAEVMQTNLITVQEDTGIDEAIRLMSEKRLKRLPVVAPDGAFRGIISRDSVLRAGHLTQVKG
jgi:CBS domain-containing protein